MPKRVTAAAATAVELIEYVEFEIRNYIVRLEGDHNGLWLWYDNCSYSPISNSIQWGILDTRHCWACFFLHQFMLCFTGLFGCFFFLLPTFPRIRKILSFKFISFVDHYSGFYLIFFSVFDFALGFFSFIQSFKQQYISEDRPQSLSQLINVLWWWLMINSRLTNFQLFTQLINQI